PLQVAFQDALTEATYPASLAGLSYDLDFTAKGLRLTVGGYNDRLADFTRKIASRLYSFSQELSSSSSSSSAFSRYKDIVTRELASFDNLQPYQHAGYHANLLLEDPKWPISQVRAALTSLSPSDLITFASPSSLFKEGYGTALLQGNVREEEAVALLEEVAAVLPFQSVLPVGERPTVREGGR
ncbi:insulin-degrading enzyme, partial [Nannochloropsis gaditana]